MQKPRPPKNPKTIKGAFKEFYKIKADEQHLYHEGEKIPIHKLGIYNEGEIVKTLPHPQNENDKLAIISDKFVQKLSPDNIDTIQFWEKADKYFPINAIAGQRLNTLKEIDDYHDLMLEKGKFDFIADNINPDDKILEIGVGFGSMYKSFLKKELIKPNNWHFLDVVDRLDFKHPNFHKGNGWDIPKSLNKLDVIISYNCFQHMSQKQRYSYFIDAFDRLKSGGKFIFTCFTYDDYNHSNGHLFGRTDEEGYPLTYFFGQHTRSLLATEATSVLENIGFEFKKVEVYDNNGLYQLIKP